MRKIFLHFFNWIIFLMVFVFFSTCLLFLLAPQVLVNNTTLKLARKYIIPKEINLQAEELNVQISSESLLRKQLVLNAKDLCLTISPVDTCVKAIDLRLVFTLTYPLKINEVGPLSLETSKLLVDLSLPGEDNKDPQKTSPLPRWLNLSEAKINHLALNLPAWELKTKEETFSGRFKINTQAVKQGGGWQIALATNPNSALKQLELDLDVFNTEANGQGLWSIKLDTKVQVEDKKTKQATKISLKGSGKQKNKQNDLDYNLDLNFVQAKDKSLSGRVWGSYGITSLDLNLEATAYTGQAIAPKVVVKPCLLNYNSPKSGGYNLGIDCSFLADILLPFPPEFPAINLPKSTGGRVVGNINAKSLSLDSLLRADIKFDLEPILTPLFEGRGNIQLNASGKINQFPKNFDLKTTLDLQMIMPNFKLVVDTLDKTNMAVPAPINAMQGRVELGVKGEADLKNGKFPVYLTTKLNSAHQTLNLDANGDYSYTVKELDLKNNKFNLTHQVNMEAVLSEIKLALPRLDLEKPPALLNDRRIREPVLEIEKKLGLDLNYNLKIRTPVGKPVLILSNLALAPIPVFVNLDLIKDQPMMGEISLGTFPIKLFKRNAVLEYLSLKFRNAKEPPLIDGLATVNYTDYTIRVVLIGNTVKPIVQLDSEPPLTEDQLVAVLIFGRPIEELDESEGESVSSTKSALGDGAIGLASLYLLASTPIESIGYDSDTGEVSAKVRVGAGTSLNLGTNRVGDQKVGLKKRLGKHFSVTTDLTNPEDETEKNSISTFLEWSKRY